MKSELLLEYDLVTIHDTDLFYVAMLAASPLLILDEVPNYFLFNKQTGKIEAMSNSLHAIKQFIGYLTNLSDTDVFNMVEDVKLPDPPMIN